jgi:translation initiation factor 1
MLEIKQTTTQGNAVAECSYCLCSCSIRRPSAVSQSRQGLIVRLGKFIYQKMAVICKKCGLPDDLCACGELEKEETRIVVRLETRRFSKTTTLIEGIDPKSSNVNTMVKELKSKFACGGTAKAGFIMLQGDHREDVKGFLVKKGFTESAIEVQ